MHCWHTHTILPLVAEALCVCCVCRVNAPCVCTVVLLPLLQGAFGSDSMLGPLEDNDPDMGDDEEGDEADEMDADDELTAALARTHI